MPASTPTVVAAPAPATTALVNTPTTTPTSVPPTATPSPTPGTSEDIETLRKISEAYWEAFNSYDADAAVAMYNETYRAAREEAVRADISLMKMFKASLKVTEESPPVLTAPNVGELYVRVDNPLGIRRVLMVFHKLEDGWKIVHAEEVSK